MRQNYYFLPYNKKLGERSKDLYKNETEAEKKIYSEYFSKFSFRVRRQKIIDNYIVDFYIPKYKLIIEIDGKIHENKKEYDKDRSLILKKYNLKIIRIKNKDIFENSEMLYKKMDILFNKLECEN